MAPHSSGMVETVYQTAPLALRNLGNQTVTAPSYTSAQKYTLDCLALSFSTISVASSILAFYWFLKMRRSFRHDLIMFLIQSDMFKAVWFMVYPIVIFTHGPVANNSSFCQVHGFFQALSIEASDFAILMIAVHTALYIFKPQHSPGEGGLYPYRYIAYALWIIFPVLMASLAFVNHQDGYVSAGTSCYLPVRPFWYRLALAWIPRYIIFLVILAVYASIYYYVRYKFDAFDRVGKLSVNSEYEPPRFDDPPQERREESIVPPTPTLACHGLIVDSRRASWNNDQEARKQPGTEINRFQRRGSRGVNRFMLAASLGVGDEPLVVAPENSIAEEDSFVAPSTPQPLPQLSEIPVSPTLGSMPSVMPSASRATSWRDSFVKRFSLPDSRGQPSTKHSVVDILTILRHHPDSSDMETPISQLQLLTSGHQTTGDAELLRVRIQIQRQLRFLFIYPLVYIGMWIIPFASHVLQYNDKYAISPPFELQCATTVFTCSQAAIDCWLFSTREKPWRQIPSGNGGFWESLKFWTGWEGARRWRSGHGPGKTRAEMDREARAAYMRREEELSQRKNNVEREATKRGERSWWEVGIDGTMSPVIEEADPFENPTTSPGGGEDSMISGQSKSAHSDATTGRER